MKHMKSHNHHVAFYLCTSIILLIILALATTAIPASAQRVVKVIPTDENKQPGGLNVLSLSKADYSWSGEVQEDAWILYITQSSSGEQIYGVIDKEDITGKDPITGEQGFATHDIEISMKTISTTCNYPILPKTDYGIYPPIRKAYVDREECKLTLRGIQCNWNGDGDEMSVDDWEDECESGRDGGDFRRTKKSCLLTRPVLACFYETEGDIHGVLQTPTYDFSTEVIVTKKGPTQDTISTVISNRERETNAGTGKKSAKLGSFGYIEWTGNLASGESCPMRDLPDATYTTTGWTLTDRGGYDTYKVRYPTDWDVCKDNFEEEFFWDPGEAKSAARKCVDELNELASDALTEGQIRDPVVLNNETSNKYALDGAIFKADIKPGAIYHPTYKLILSASWVGIYVPKPEPSITNIRSEWDESRSQGKFWVDIKNVGDEGGDFTYGMTCQSPAQVIEPDRSDYWDKDQVKTVELSVTGAVSEETKATCTVHVYATKYPDIRVERTATITMKPIPTPSTPAGADSAAPPKEGGKKGASTFLPYGILALAFIGIIVIMLLWRRGGTASTPAESGGAEAKRPSSAKWIAAIIILLLILGLGLFVVTSLKQPEVSLKSVSVKEVENIDLLIVEIPTEVIFSVALDVYNPNFLGATVTDVEYDLYVNDVYVGKGFLPRSVTIPANGKTNVETEVSVSVPSTIQALITTIQQRGATAKVNGKVYISVPILGSISVPFSEEQKLV